VRRLAGIAATLALLCAPAAAEAAIPSVFGGEVACETQADGVRFCGSSSPRSTVKTFDGVPIDVNAAFPPEPAAGPDGNYPLVMIFHGYGGGKIGLGGMQRWLDRGYATFSMTDRGFRESCGSEASRAADPAGCENGFVRLIDDRYEVRDAQLFAGRLADEGLVHPQRIGAIGASYGGGLSAALAVLRNRTMMPDGSLVPWTSPNGTPMQLAAAAPWIAWTDLAYSLAPNGSTLDYVTDSAYEGRPGVMKQSLVNGLYISGQLAPGYYAPVGTPGADLTGWRDRLLAGEPYGPDVQAIIRELTEFHSSFYVDAGVEPAPLLFANGFVDDLFPVDEAIRLYNRTRSDYPDAPFAMFAGDIAGHPRSQIKLEVLAAMEERQNAWFDFYVKGAGEEPFQGVEAMTETCPGSAPSGGPHTAPNWARLAPGEIRLSGGKMRRTIAPSGGDPEIAATLSPVGGGGACAQVGGGDEPGTLDWELEPAPRGGFTLMGSPTVIADFKTTGETSQVAARLFDVGPDGQATLVARGLWRPGTGPGRRQVFQLHPNGWQFARGHAAKLQLLAKDSGGGDLNSYGRASNDQQPVQVSKLQLRLPVLEDPGALDGFVGAPAPKFVPRGYSLASDFAELPDLRPRLGDGRLRVRGDELRAKLECPDEFEACHDLTAVVKSSQRGAGKFVVARGGVGAIDGGRAKILRMELSPDGERYFERNGSLRTKVILRSEEVVGATKTGRRAS
jgi:fermentation-respiration switch protein FrsA (DUF1100 family)